MDCLLFTRMLSSWIAESILTTSESLMRALPVQDDCLLE